MKMDDKLRRMKESLEDNLIEQNCSSGEFNFGDVCAGHGTRKDNGEDTYGMPIEETDKMFPDGCDDYGISFDSYIEQEKLNGR